jgi:hypothetical protein
MLRFVEIKFGMLAMAESYLIDFDAKERSRESKARGAKARALKLSPEERRAIAREAARARWHPEERSLEAAPEGDEVALSNLDTSEGDAGLSLSQLPTAEHRGFLRLAEAPIPCYVLSNGQRVIGRTSVTEMLTGIKGGGGLEKYLGTVALRSFINVQNVFDRMVEFRLPETSGLDTRAMGMPADLLIEVCQGFVAALDAHTHPESGIKLTSRQIEMAIKASIFVSACAKVGLEALIDEATGYQYERAQDALEVKLRAYLVDEMRKWERTFPDELWVEFGRLTGWSHSVTKRPKYWGRLVMELVYDYLDKDVADWLRENAPKPQRGQNYHQWLTSQYGLRKLTEHIWKVIGIAKTCQDISELKEKMGQIHGRIPIQYRLFLPAPEARMPGQRY